MSSLNFLTRAGDASVSGRERIKFNGLLHDLAWRTVERECDPRETLGPSLLRQAVRLPGWVSVNKGNLFAQTAKLYLDTGHDDADVVLLPDAPQTPAASVLDVHVNTVIAGYPDPVALAVRLAAQCQVNAWVDGPDRKWLADLIHKGRHTMWPAEAVNPDVGGLPLFNDGWSVNGTYDGWPGVVKMLRSDDTGAVVLTSSATDGFPSQVWAGREGQDREEFHRWWKDADPGQRWDASEVGLREETATTCPALKITPDSLHDPRFGFTRTGITWSHLAAVWRAGITP